MVRDFARKMSEIKLIIADINIINISKQYGEKRLTRNYDGSVAEIKVNVYQNNHSMCLCKSLMKIKALRFSVDDG